MVLTQMHQLVSVVQLDMYPIKAVLNVNRVKQVNLVMLRVKRVKIAMPVNIVKVKKTMVLTLPIQHDALIA